MSRANTNGEFRVPAQSRFTIRPFFFRHPVERHGVDIRLWDKDADVTEDTDELPHSLRSTPCFDE